MHISINKVYQKDSSFNLTTLSLDQNFAVWEKVDYHKRKRAKIFMFLQNPTIQSVTLFDYTRKKFSRRERIFIKVKLL